MTTLSTEANAGSTNTEKKGADVANSDLTDVLEPAVEAGQAETVDESAVGSSSDNAAAGSRHVSISVRALAVGAVVIGFLAAIGTMTWLYLGVKAEFDDQARRAADSAHAEQISLDYAVNAAVMDYKDLGPWKQNLVKNMTPELKEKLTKAAIAMEQILLPLQWSSTASPIAAKVRSVDNGVYIVDAFVSVMTKTVQAGENLQSTATYSITVDSNNEWQISDVGGIAAAVENK